MAADNLRQLEALKSRLAQDCATHRQPADISPHTPHTLSTDLNEADKIERHLRADGHRVWGFVGYRCRYTSDSTWESCIQRINTSVRSVMDLYYGHDLLQEDCFELTVIADAGSQAVSSSLSMVISIDSSLVHHSQQWSWIGWTGGDRA